MKVIWREKAHTDLADIMEYVTQKESYSRAKKLVIQIIGKAKGITNFPEKYQRETLINTDRNIRRAIIYSYKIVYEITNGTIIILRVFNTAQNPDKLNNI